MLRTGKDYIESLRDGREVWIDGEQVADVTTHPAFAPIVDVRARIYDLAHEDGTRDLMTYTDEQTASPARPPRARRAPARTGGPSARPVDAILDDAGGVVTRVGDETVGEMWSLFDGQDVLNEIDPAFSANIAPPRPARRSCSTRSTSRPTPTRRATGRCGRRTRTPTCCCTWSARPTTASWSAAPSSRPRRPTPTRRSSSRPSATGTTRSCPTTRSASWPTWARPGIKHICRSAFAGRRARDDYPLTSRYDEIDTMIVFDDVEIPWENVFFYRHTKAAAFIRATLHRYSIFPFVQRYLRFADLLLGVAYASARSDRGHDAPGRAGEDRADRVLPRGHQRAPDRGDRAGRAQPGRAADAQPGDDVHRPGVRLLPAAGDHAPRPRPVRLPGQPDAQHGHVRQPRAPATGCGSTSRSARSPRRNGASCSRWPVTCSTPTTPGTG